MPLVSLACLIPASGSGRWSGRNGGEFSPVTSRGRFGRLTTVQFVCTGVVPLVVAVVVVVVVVVQQAKTMEVSITEPTGSEVTLRFSSRVRCSWCSTLAWGQAIAAVSAASHGSTEPQLNWQDVSVRDVKEKMRECEGVAPQLQHILYVTRGTLRIAWATFSLRGANFFAAI